MCAHPTVAPVNNKGRFLCCLQTVNLPRGFAYVEYKTREDAEKARMHMDGGQLDGNVLRCAACLGVLTSFSCTALHAVLGHHCMSCGRSPKVKRDGSFVITT